MLYPPEVPSRLSEGYEQRRDILKRGHTLPFRKEIPWVINSLLYSIWDEFTTSRFNIMAAVSSYLLEGCLFLRLAKFL